MVESDRDHDTVVEVLAMTNAGQQNLLPIWHNVTKDQVVAHSPSLADKVARSTATHTIEEIAEEIASVVRPIE